MSSTTLGRRTARFRCRLRGGTAAFSLVEVVMAIGIISFCLLTLVAMVSVGLGANRLVREQVVGLSLCREIESDLKATASTNSVSPLYQIPIPAVGATTTTTRYDSYASSTASFSTTRPTTGSQYRFTITLTGASNTSPNDPVNARIQATWPPQIVPSAPSSLSNPTNVIGTVNLDVAVNRFGS
jgi:type II secretory pathway pseudopilin PulG